jgi:hypothetical protein
MTHFWRRLRRAWALLHVYWGTGDYDWTVITLLMRHQIRRTRLHIIDHDIIAGIPHMARQMLVAEELMKRIEHDVVYYNNAGKLLTTNWRDWAAHMKMQEEQDMVLLGSILQKHLKSWWC